MAEIVVNIPRPHPGQERIEREGKRHVMLRCGRRYGKTKFGVYRALKVVIPGGKVGWFAPTNKYALEAWREVVSRLRPLVEALGGRISEQEKRIELPNGAVFEVWSLNDNDDPARGREYDLVIIDEAGLVGNLLVVWLAAIEPTLATTDGSSLFLGTPKGARTPFNIMFKDAETGVDPEWSAFNGKTVENTTRPKLVEAVRKARARAERMGTLSMFMQEYEGTPADDGSNPIGLRAIEMAVQVAPSGREVVAWGVDLARSVDFTVAYGFDALGRWAQLHRWQGDWGATKKRLQELIGYDTPVVMDATGVGSPIVQDLQLSGMQVTPFVFSYNSRGMLIEDLITGIHGQRLTIPDGWVRLELESLGVELTQIGPRYAVPSGMHDDGIMALALAWRCYGYFAPTPDWPTDSPAHPWSESRDMLRLMPAKDVDEDAAFGSLGSGW